MISRVAAVLLVAFCVAAAAPRAFAAQDGAPELGLPVACAVGTDCQVSRYVDDDASPNAIDHGCGSLTADGNPGTDFSLRDGRAMADGVAVLAAAPGRVVDTHDGEPDVGARGAEQALLTGTGCGNAVVIDHGGGWISEYCHLRGGSLTVTPGATVDRGAPLGKVGLSGATNHPHLHFRLRRDGAPIDPFRGLDRASGCGPSAGSLWNASARAVLTYQPFVVLNAGFSMGQPRKEEARAGAYRDTALPATAPALAFWLEVLGVVPGDAVSMRVLGPDGAPVLSGNKAITDIRGSWFGWIGKKRGFAPWPVGSYRATVKLARPGRSYATVVEKTFTVEITP